MTVSSGIGLFGSENSSLQASREGPLRIPLQSLLGPKSSSGAEAATSGFLSSADMDLRHPMEFQQGIQALSRAETWKSASSPSVKVVSGFLTLFLTFSYLPEPF